MAKRWTVLVVPHGAGRSKSVHLSHTALRVVLGVGAAVALTGITLMFTAIAKSVDLSRMDGLERQNALLATELTQTRALIAQIGDTVSAIARRDEQVRLLAGLEPVDPDVQRAGIGGPAVRPSEDERLLAEASLGREALAQYSDMGELLRHANLLANDWDQVVDGLRNHSDLLARTPSIFPTVGHLSSPFAQARIHPIYHVAMPHEGIDISAPMNTPIIAAAGGIVVAVTNENGYGNLITIDHGNGVVTKYGHCSRILARVGQKVQRGDVIGKVGNTGISTGPHLHYEVILNGRPVNPRKYILDRKAIPD
jgi:murein DD-endopeptidase MepM/ murein hydrolase activator NlpD